MEMLLNRARAERNAFRPLPFWSWNDTLDEERLRLQVRQMHRAGLGGFFMHARVGLRTPYMGEQWFRCIKACISEAESLGMEPWGYDENGYPSGIADGQVCRESEAYRATWIELKTVSDPGDWAGLHTAAWYFRDPETGEYRRCAEGDFPGTGLVAHIKNEMRSADPMNAKAVRLFLELTHQRYREELGADFGRHMPGFFTDEPQLKQYQLPWSQGFDRLFREEYGYDLLDQLPALKDDSIVGHEAVRHDYWMLVNRLYCDSFGKQVHQWCRDNGCRFTGHVMGEDTLLEQMGSNGGVMAFYPHMDMPGMDWLGRRIGSPLAPKQVASAAAQTGRRHVLSETFALSGWDVSFADLKWIAEWQMANGISRLCPHLESYSIRGIRKRDYPASLFVQEPWWEKYAGFTDYVSALGAALSAAPEACDLLVIHPLHTAHVRYNGSAQCQAVRVLDDHFAALSRHLQELHIPYHYGDEVVLQDYGSVEGDTLRVGEMRYRRVLLPDMDNILSSTLSLLERFAASGGTICRAGKLPHLVDGRPDNRIAALPVTELPEADQKSFLGGWADHLSVLEVGKECPAILSAIRHGDDSNLYFLVNLDRDAAHSVIVSCADTVGLNQVLLPSMETVPVRAEQWNGGVRFHRTLQPGESILLISAERQEPCSAQEPTVGVSLPAAMRIKARDLNALTLDRCQYAVGEGPWQPEIPLIRLQKQLLDAQTDDRLRLKFHFDVDMDPLPASLKLVSENIPDFSLTVNGIPVTVGDDWYLDPDFHRVEIGPCLRKGQNELILTGRFFQRRELYDYLYRDKDLSSNFYAVDFEFESVTYDVELESIYLMGDFCVDTPGEYRPGNRRARFTDGAFRLTAPRRELNTGDITTQGYPFFAGTMDLEFRLQVEKKPGVRYVLAEPKPDCPAAQLFVNGADAGMLLWEPVRPDITELLRDGENILVLRLYSGLRNLLGPHHYRYGESYYVGVSTFGDLPGWCEAVEGVSGNLWNDGYCFVTFGPAGRAPAGQAQP
ncbi:MAG: glycosyl hydrolase [Firmicutes bacterium]|nr:glycosyl hydrolase [Bacillota bacterium]